MTGVYCFLLVRLIVIVLALCLRFDWFLAYFVVCGCAGDFLFC